MMQHEDPNRPQNRHIGDGVHAGQEGRSIDIQCGDCGGTGLHAGIGERDGLAVVCRQCGGAGKQTVTLVPFSGRQKRDGISRVLQTNPGIVLTPELTRGGVSYQEWLQDPESARQPGREAREHYCPAWWYRTADPAHQPEWEECRGHESFTKCPLFARKDGCWERFDSERFDSERAGQESA